MKRKLLATFLPLALVPLMGAGLFAYIRAKRALTEKAFAHLESIASLQKSLVENSLDEHFERFDLVRDRLQIRMRVDHYLPYPTKKDAARLQRMLLQTKLEGQGFQTLSILSRRGTVMGSTDRAMIGRDLSKERIYNESKKRNFFDVVRLPGNEKYGVYFAGPLTYEREFLGVFLVEENLDQMLPWIRDNSGLGNTGEAFLAKKLSNGKALYLTALRFDPEASMRRVANGQEEASLKQALQGIEKPVDGAVDYRLQSVIATTRFIKKANWGLIVKIDQAEAFASVTELRRWFYLFLLISALSIIALSHKQAMSIVQPLAKLTAIAQDMERGQSWPPDAKFPPKNEIGLLAGAFQSMAGNLLRSKESLEQRVREHTEELQRSRAFLNSIVENIPNMIFVKSAEDLRFVSFNKAGEELLGLSRDALIGKNDYDFFPREQADFFTAKDKDVLSAKKLVDISEEPIHTAKKELRLLHTKKIPILDEQGIPRYLLGISEDITEQKKAEKYLLEQQAELARSKAEREQLQLFASVAAHDLQEPLQKIVSFGDLLRVECGSTINEEGKDYLMRMRNAAKRMSELISDLLKFSKAATKEEPLETVDLKTVVEDVMSDLELRIYESGARITVGPMPTVRANRVQFREVIQNLISNAIKFRKKTEPPFITLQARDFDDTVEITVADNGIGFDEKFSERIFRPFERLHRRTEYAGSGIGLAICQRIVARHGGKITVRSKLGEGSAFTIKLPKGATIHEHARGAVESVK